jgi:hypothetical protein
MASKEIAGINWSADHVLPTFQAPQHLTIYDLRGASQEVQLSASTMAGLINRPQPQVYLIISDEDAFWLKELLGSIPQETSPLDGDHTLEAMLISFRNSTQGMIIYNPNFVDSINIATTMAGQRDAIVVAPDQVQDLQQAHNLPVLANLRTYHWANRLEAYDWARQNLLEGASSHVIAGLDPKIAAGPRAFLVATRAFVYWLDPRLSVPDVFHGFKSERDLMQEIFKTFPPGAVHLGWFIDEGSGVTLTSNAAMVVLATDFCYNLEVWTSVPPTTPIAQAASATPEPAIDRNKVYVSFTVSDGDNLQYIQHRMLRLWRDPVRGSFPLGWTISPVLGQAAPTIAAYYVGTAKPDDEFVAGPSGAGYMFPSRWPQEHLPAFLQRTGQTMQAMNLKTLEVLDVDFLLTTGIPLIANIRQTGMVLSNMLLQQQFLQALLPFNVFGLLSGAGTNKADWVVSQGKGPVYQNLGLADSINKTLHLVRNAASDHQERPLFLNVYIMAWSMTPSDVKQVIQQLGSGYEVVKPTTLLAMLAKAKGQ